MSTIEQSIDVRVPARTAYDEWTRFETFPRFMEVVEERREFEDTRLRWRTLQFDDTRLRWRTRIAGGREQQVDAEITEQHPDHHVAWRSTGGACRAGTVTFQQLADDRTRVMLRLDAEPDMVSEDVGAALDVVGTRVKDDLERFRGMIESRGRAGRAAAPDRGARLGSCGRSSSRLPPAAPPRRRGRGCWCSTPGG